MDLITYALAKKYTDKKIISATSHVIPQIGENGNWFIDGIDSGISATPPQNLEVDGVLKIDRENKKIFVDKDGEETLIAEYHESIETGDIEKLFEEE